MKVLWIYWVKYNVITQINFTDFFFPCKIWLLKLKFHITSPHSVSVGQCSSRWIIHLGRSKLLWKNVCFGIRRVCCYHLAGLHFKVKDPILCPLFRFFGSQSPHQQVRIIVPSMSVVVRIKWDNVCYFLAQDLGWERCLQDVNSPPLFLATEIRSLLT